MFLSGFKFSEISKGLGINLSTVKRRLEKMGLKRKTKIRRIAAHRLVRNTKAYRTWRSSILSRSGHACAFCGANERLEVDHIEPVSKRVDLVMADSNARVLCNPCHRTTDSYPKSLAVFDQIRN